MQTYTTTSGIGQLISRPVDTPSLSQTAAPSYPNYIVFELVWQGQEMPPIIVRGKPDQVDEQALAALYAEFAEEDRALAKAGMADYARMLAREDKDA